METHRAAIYVRTNRDARSVREHRRIFEQVEECLALAASKGFAEEDIYIYKDEGLSGRSCVALGLNRLLNELPSYCVVIVPTLNRLSRDSYRVAEVLAKFKKAGVSLWTCNCTEQLDQDTLPMQIIRIPTQSDGS